MHDTLSVRTGNARCGVLAQINIAVCDSAVIDQRADQAFRSGSRSFVGEHGDARTRPEIGGEIVRRRRIALRPAVPVFGSRHDGIAPFRISHEVRGDFLQYGKVSAAVGAQIDDEVFPAALLHERKTLREFFRRVPAELVQTDIRRFPVCPRKRVVRFGKGKLLVSAESVRFFAVPIITERRLILLFAQFVYLCARFRIAAAHVNIARYFGKAGDKRVRIARKLGFRRLSEPVNVHPLADARLLRGGILYEKRDKGKSLSTDDFVGERDPDALVLSLAFLHDDFKFLGRIIAGVRV